MPKQNWISPAPIKPKTQSSVGYPNMTDLQANDYNWTVTTKTASHVLVADDVGTRIAMNAAAPSTVTVNTGIFAAGDTLKIQNLTANTVTVVAGTATVVGAGGLTLARYQEGTLYFISAGSALFLSTAVTSSPSGLVRVGGGPLAGASTTFLNAFSANFKDYVLVITDAVPAGGATTLILKFGATITLANYGIVNVNHSTGAVAGQGIQNGNGFSYVARGTTHNVVTIEVLNPFEAVNTFVNYWNVIDQNTANGASNWINGYQNDITSYTDFKLVADAGTYTGLVNIYGRALS